jgi:phage/plasmid-associated DNA primase
LPKIRHSDKATWNRIRVIPFETTFVPIDQDCPQTYEEQLFHKKFPMDPEFSKKIPGLLSAFAWVLLEHRKKNLGKPIIEPEKVKMATYKYRNQNDVFKQYTEENIIYDEHSFIKLNELYENFKVWYKQSFPGSTIPQRNEIKDRIIKAWGEPENQKWRNKKIRTIDDDMMEQNQLININPLL